MPLISYFNRKRQKSIFSSSKGNLLEEAEDQAFARKMIMDHVNKLDKLEFSYLKDNES